MNSLHLKVEIFNTLEWYSNDQFFHTIEYYSFSVFIIFRPFFFYCSNFFCLLYLARFSSCDAAKELNEHRDSKWDIIIKIPGRFSQLSMEVTAISKLQHNARTIATSFNTKENLAFQNPPTGAALLSRRQFKNLKRQNPLV